MRLPLLRAGLVNDAELFAVCRALAQVAVQFSATVVVRLGNVTDGRHPVNVSVRDSQVYVVLVSGDDSPNREVVVGPFMHSERCPSGQILDDERPAALEGFDAGFERADSRLVGFDACHECLFPSLLEARVAVAQVALCPGRNEVKLLACFGPAAPTALPKSVFVHAHTECHPFVHANGDD